MTAHVRSYIYAALFQLWPIETHGLMINLPTKTTAAVLAIKYMKMLMCWQHLFGWDVWVTVWHD